MQSAVLLLVLAQVASSFVLPIQLSSVSEQSEKLTKNDNYWTTTVIIGTPGTAFTVAIDTTSSFLFVPDVSTDWKTDTFNMNKSSSYHNFGEIFWINSEFGTTYGYVGFDTVILGASFSNDPKRSSITVTNATFGASLSVPPYMPAGIDGVLGLAFPSLAPSGTLPVFQSAINQSCVILSLEPGVFSEDVSTGTFVIWLEDQWTESDNGAQGVIYYGNTDNVDCHVSQRHDYPLSSATLFQFTMSSFKMTSPSGRYNYNTKSQAVISSTSEHIAAPPVVVRNVLAQLGLDQNSDLPITVPCNTKIDLAFNFSSGTEHVTERNLVLQQADGSCILALINSYKIENNIIPFELGIPFLRGRCTYFGVSNQKIGFSAPNAH